MSTTTSPVTHVALVAVKKAVMGEVHSLLLDEMGSIRSIVPTIITVKKPSTITSAGLILNLSFITEEFNL